VSRKPHENYVSNPKFCELSSKIDFKSIKNLSLHLEFFHAIRGPTFLIRAQEFQIKL